LTFLRLPFFEKVEYYQNFNFAL